MIDGKYQQFKDEIELFISPNLIYTDYLHTFAYGTDASFYRLIPKIVVMVQHPDEVSKLLKVASRLMLPVVFRAAGTSISGQAITDSILVVSSRDWREIRCNNDASLISLAPSVIGAEANKFLAPYARKIGPDPASLACAMIGGIAANNASGMCCGIADNSYKTLESIKVIMVDGTRLNTASQTSKEAFRKSHSALLNALSDLSEKTCNNSALKEKIARKFKIKNTCGYSLNALIDYTDPIDILSHLLIGSEGTLGYIEEITYRTVPEYADKASALMIFKSIKDACDAVRILKQDCFDVVDAAELMDRAALRSMENETGLPDFLKTLSATAAALLVETRAPDPSTLQSNIMKISSKLENTAQEKPFKFTTVKAEYEAYWKIRKGLYPVIGAVRELGTTIITEDVAYPIEYLADAVVELQEMFAKYDYDDVIIIGHALEGNLHLLFSQSFEIEGERERYEALMNEITQQVAIKYKGSLKAEHGTGRNIAPFVSLEWGEDAYELMWAIKDILDPNYLLNPGVILNRDPEIHLKNLKATPKSDDAIDRCIECGFCESKCPSTSLTLSPRQRIAVYREMTGLEARGETATLQTLKKQFEYDGIETCATCELCSICCPININTATLTKKLRAEQIGTVQQKVAWQAAKHYGGLLKNTGMALNSLHWLNKKLPKNTLGASTKILRKITKSNLPQWNSSLPSGLQFNPKTPYKNKNKVVYFSSCINRTMANPKQENEAPLYEVIINLLEKSGYEVIIPESISSLCCGMPFESKGYSEQAQKQSEDLLNSLLTASKNGKYPILSDMSPCTKTMTKNLSQRYSQDPAKDLTKKLNIYDSATFITTFLLDKLPIQQMDEPIIIHHTCSSQKQNWAEDFEKIANICSTQVTIPNNVTCCGFAGDKGFTHPELNQSALRSLNSEIPTGTKLAFSTSKTCEIGLSEESGLAYRSVWYLLDKCVASEE